MPGSRYSLVCHQVTMRGMASASCKGPVVIVIVAACSQLGCVAYTHGKQ